MGGSKALRAASAGLVAPLLAFGLATSQADASNVLVPMLLTFSDLPGTWAPDPQSCQGYTYQNLFRYGYGAKDAVETCLDNSADDLIDETLALYPSHLAAEAGWHKWVVDDERDKGTNRVKVHVTFPVPVIFDELTPVGPSNALWDVDAVKGRVVIFLNYAAGPKVDPVIGIFHKALGKVSEL
jgi:hypothetical protein